MAAACLGALLCTATVVFASLGIWQVERRAWKLDLIARVEARIHAAPGPLPGPASWPTLRPNEFAYRRVAAEGRFLPGPDTRVQALTERGAGYWVVTPFRADDGFTVLVNRGFVPSDAPAGASAEAGPAPTRLAGLLRPTEPQGGFLRRNDPGADRWFSRDVAAIAEARGLGSVAPYFVDADASGRGAGAPVGGLTVVAFRNTHLVYALTWFGLACLTVVGAAYLWRDVRGGTGGRTHP